MPKVDREQLIRDIAEAQGRDAKEVRAELREVERTLSRTTTVVAKPRSTREKAAKALAGAADFTKSEFERNLAAEVEAEQLLGELPERCAECGHKFRYCTCGAKVPWDCARCIKGRGRGHVFLGRNRMGWPIYSDRLCAKHEALGHLPRNRAERRQAMRSMRRSVPRRLRRRIETIAVNAS